MSSFCDHFCRVASSSFICALDSSSGLHILPTRFLITLRGSSPSSVSLMLPLVSTRLSPMAEHQAGTSAAATAPREPQRDQHRNAAHRTLHHRFPPDVR
jgi:hypothetical protein